MDETYDVIVLGTGLAECVVSGLLAMEGRRVLHLDRQPYYGGECASLSLARLYEHAGRERPYDGRTYGRDRDWAVDLVPKLIMATGGLVDILVHTDVTRYLDFQQVAGSFVYTESGGVCKVPCTEREALTSGLMGFFEKRRAYSFFEYIRTADPADRTTWAGRDLETTTMAQLYAAFGLQPSTQDFVGHALALQQDESYLDRPAAESIARVRLYMASMLRFGRSPYVYPLYGLGELPQAFARLSAIYGGTFMLDTPVAEILRDADGRVCGIRTRDGVARCRDGLVAAPAYVPERTVPGAHVVRAVCILDHPLPAAAAADSAQLIVPARQAGRRNDVYVSALSHVHRVCPAPYHVVTVSTVAEGDVRSPRWRPEDEVRAGLALLGPVLETFCWTTQMWSPDYLGSETASGDNPTTARRPADGLHIARSYDSTSHFETVVDDVRRLYAEVTGRPLVLRQRPSPEDEAALSRSASASGQSASMGSSAGHV